MSEVKKTKKTNDESNKKVASKKKNVIKKDKTEVKKSNSIKKETKVKEIKKTKEIVAEEVLMLSKKEQTNYSILSKSTRIIAKIARICLMIFVPFIFLAMIIMPILLSKLEISGNVIKINDVNIIVRDSGVSFKIGDYVQVFDCNTNEFDKIMTFLNENSNGSIIFSFELSMLLLSIIIILDIYILINIENLFSNFEIQKTPFTEENTAYILAIAKYLLVSKIVTICLSMVCLFNPGFSSISIIELLIVFTVYYIFKYATNVQKKVDTKIYN